MCTKNPKSLPSHSISVTSFKSLYFAGITFLGQTKKYLFLGFRLRVSHTQWDTPAYKGYKGVRMKKSLPKEGVSEIFSPKVGGPTKNF